MFIKFSDKTKKIIVKTSKDGYSSELNEDFDTINLYKKSDSKDVDDRRIEILNTYLDDDEAE
jgi:hypothetical protein